MTALLPAMTRLKTRMVIFLVCLGGLLVEVGYTRIVSYKLWYYYTYLVLGLALLGIGSGGVVVSLSKRLKEIPSERLLPKACFTGGLSILASYFLNAVLPIDTIRIWDYGTASSLKNLLLLGIMSGALFGSFVALGVVISVILSRGGNDIGRLYAADLIGAGLACMVAIPLISGLGAPAAVMVGAACFAVASIVSSDGFKGTQPALSAVLAVVLVVLALFPSLTPDIRIEGTKPQDPSKVEYSEWGPVFRVDAISTDSDTKLLAHDGSYGSAIHRYNGDPDTLERFDSDPRSIPFTMLGADPQDRDKSGNDHTLIIGSAGGNEILASLYYGSKNIEGVELNPVTIGLLTDHFKQFTGDLTAIDNVTVHNADGRSFLARSNDDYDLIWYVAPDSYAANNAASSGAFVLSESYLYTVSMIKETLEHLSEDGIMVVQFGELDFEGAPNRTSRYLMTAHQALEELGITDHSKHLLVAAELQDGFGDLSTIVLKRTPITEAETSRALDAISNVPKTKLQFAPGSEPAAGIVGSLASAPDLQTATERASIVDRNIFPVTDDAPFFWHFVDFGTVLGDITRPLNSLNPEDSIGERVLLLLLAISVLYAAVFLFVPFLRRSNKGSEATDRPFRQPLNGPAILYFASLGLGFMLYEISLLQRLTLLLGYPTLSLSVTLATILISTGIGSALAGRAVARFSMLPWLLLGALAALAAVYQFAVGAITEATLSSPTPVRILVAVLLLLPLGCCLGMFMPLGLSKLAHLRGAGDESATSHEPEDFSPTDQAQHAVAYAWAINGFFSVIGSVLTTILSMTFGFRNVMFLALAIYMLAALSWNRIALRSPADSAAVSPAAA